MQHVRRRDGVFGLQAAVEAVVPVAGGGQVGGVGHEQDQHVAVGIEAAGDVVWASIEVPDCDPIAAPILFGDGVEHEKLIEFIARNYEPDAQGRWYFQNGPQRVYVELELTPWIWRVGQDFAVRAHTGAVATPRLCLLDELGRVYLDTDLGLGLIHTMDVAIAAEAVLQGLWLPIDVASEEMPARFGYVVSPESQRAG